MGLGVLGANGVAPTNVIATGLFYFILINLFLGFFNLLPIPPFDGGHIVEGLLPRSLAAQWSKVQQMGMLVLIVLIAVSWAFPQSNIIGNTIGWPVEWAMGKLSVVANAIAGSLS